MQTYLTQITNYLIAQSWQIAALVLIVAAIAWSLRNKSAHVRYLLWLIILAKCIVPPLVNVPLAILPQEEPSEKASVPSSSEIFILNDNVNESAFKPILVNENLIDDAYTTSRMESSPRVSKSVVNERTYSLTIQQWLGLIWIIGVIIFSLILVMKVLRTELWLRRAKKSLTVTLKGQLENVVCSLNLKAFPKIWLVEDIGQPFVWGILRGAVYLPSDFFKVNSTEQQRGILAHELSHILRYDAAVNIFQMIAQGIFWFHPLVWWINRKIRAEREKCCDEIAIARLGAKAKEFSKTIVNILTSEHKNAKKIPSLAIVGPVKNIEERIKNMLRPGKKFYKRPSVIVLTVILLLAVVIVPIGCVLTNRGESKSINQEKHYSSLYGATKAGDLNEVKRLIAEGADLNQFDEEANMTSLGFAADNGRTEIAKVLLKNGANPDIGNSRNGNTPLILAILNWNAEIVNALIESNANVNLTNYADADDPPLFYAINEDRADFVKALLDAGANPRLKSGSGQSLLKLAVKFCNPDIVKLLMNADDDVPELHKAALRGDILRLQALLKEGADINIPDEFGITPIEYALAAGQNDTVKFLIDNGIDLNRSSRWMGRSILHLAARAGLIDIVKILIDRDVPLTTLSSGSGTALHEAAMGGHKEIVELLISEGISIDSTDGSGRIPLYSAIFKNHVDIVKLLIDKGTNVNASGSPGTPLYTASINGYTELANLLRQNGAKMTLREAITLSDVDEVKNLMSQGVDINEENALGTNTLHMAALKGNKEIVELLIDNGTDVNVKNYNNVTPLHLAVKNGHKEIVELLITNGADLSIKTHTLFGGGVTALHEAVDLGRKDIVELLVANGANVNVLTEFNVSPLYIAELKDYEEIANLLRKNGAKDISPTLFGALKYGDIEQIKLLISQGADINVKRNSGRINTGQTLLHMASERGNKEVVELLIENGVDVNAKDKYGRSSLYSAVMSGHKDIAELLIDAGADVNNSGSTPLDIAQGTGQTEIVELLLEHSARRSLHGAISYGDIEEVKRRISEGINTKSKNSALLKACNSRYVDIVELLIKDGANVNVSDSMGRTPLDLAEENGHKEIVELLLKHDAKKGFSTLLNAINSGDIDLVKNIISQESNVDIRDDDFLRTALFRAVRSGHREIVELLLERGADANTQNILHLACQRGNREIVELLISNGADVNAQNRVGRTPMNLAQQRGHAEIVELLKKHGAKE